MKKNVLYWFPRILTILAILFMMLFSLDVFASNEPFSRKLLGLFMHNIPSLILTVILIIAWKWEFIGGILFLIAFFAAAIFFRSFSGNSASLLIITPFLITGVLFILHYAIYGESPAAKSKKD